MPAVKQKSVPKGCLRPVDAADFLGVYERTLANWRYRNQGPRFARLSGRLVVYKIADLEAWIDAHVVGGTE